MSNVPVQMVANEYWPDSGIFGHVDQAVFVDTIATGSLRSSCVMQFSNNQAERTEELLLEPRSVLILSGEARWTSVARHRVRVVVPGAPRDEDRSGDRTPRRVTQDRARTRRRQRTEQSPTLH